MAGDWIKMRGELFTHPRFLSLCSALVYGDQCEGFLAYACGPDILVNALPPRDETVTDRALHRVTDSALRDVTLCALLRVWCAVNSHCKVRGADAIMEPMDRFDLDSIAGFDGFGAAMIGVGWARELSPNALLFPNFLEFNEPACRRKSAKSGAERQREYRLRKCTAECTKDSVTKSDESDAREEKRREEKNKYNTPPKGVPPVPRSEPATKRFTPPTVEEVAAYCRERGNTIDPEAFVAFYTANGWKVGRNAMKDWKAAVRTWEQRRREEAARPPTAAPARPSRSESVKAVIAEFQKRQSAPPTPPEGF